MFSRRSFLGGLASLFGFGSVAGLSQGEAEKDSNPPSRFGNLPKEVQDRVFHILKDTGFADKDPNPDQTRNEFLDQLARQLFLTGTGLIWTIPTKLGGISELHVLPTDMAIPQPGGVNLDYPDGYYRIRPFISAADVYTLIPAQEVRRVKCAHPLSRYDGLSPAAYKRLLQAMRSMAPGGWSDPTPNGSLFVAAPGSTLHVIPPGSFVGL